MSTSNPIQIPQSQDSQNQNQKNLVPPTPINSLAAPMPHLTIPSSLSTMSSRNSSQSSLSLNKIESATGYNDTVFRGKEDQKVLISAYLTKQGFIPANKIQDEINWFYNQLGIEDVYFSLETIETIANHILSLWSEKLRCIGKQSQQFEIDLTKDNGLDGSVYIHSSKPGISLTEGPGVLTERKIDERYLNGSQSNLFRVESFRSESQNVRSYFVMPCTYPNFSPQKDSALQSLKSSTGPSTTRITDVSDPTFLSKASKNTLEVYENIIRIVEERVGQGPVVELFQIEGKRQYRIVIGYSRNSVPNFFSSLSDLYHYYGLYSSRKYVENFANGVTIISLYLAQAPDSTGPPIEDSIVQIMKEVSLIYVLPRNEFFGGNPDTPEANHSVQEAAYAKAGWVFVSHFANRLGSAFNNLRLMLDEGNTAQAEILADIKKRFREETFTRESIKEVILSHPRIIRALYYNFAITHYPAGDAETEILPTLSHKRESENHHYTDEELRSQIQKFAANEAEVQVLEGFLTFNKAILKTNFYQPTKVALSFRFDASFLPVTEYPNKPYGVFMVFGEEFRGFHVRFKDVARGGIRVVRPRNKEAYSAAARSLFDENYALASTQALKNKDIPEGGAKGIILPNLNSDPDLAFSKYIDALLDLLLPGSSAGIKDPIVDLFNKTEVLFFGPDENTAHLMDKAALHARSRGATWWKSATTGKSAEKLGGIPHDVYGMTSLSVRGYYTGALRKLGWKEEEITKLQTGGPDGDLGSNEILLSKDKTIAVIDGSGVLHDPNGINREELIRLARARKPVAFFDASKLGSSGYKILIDDSDIKLPSGEVVADGTAFRNTAHFRYKADVFIPCGGRPEAINISNVSKLFDAEGKPNFKVLIEGANLFVTQQARLYLEKRGVVLYKDASANKGGVTSSSLEVLAGLALKEEEYLDLMVFKDGKPSSFYKSYAKDIQNLIVRNADYEFEAIHAEFERNQGTIARTLISDQLSLKLNKLQAELEVSDLISNEKAKLAALKQVIPKTLLDLLGLDEILKRLPESYIKAIFASSVSSTFTYKYGMTASQVDFFHYMNKLAS